MALLLKSEGKQNASESGEQLVVAAIDFGTTYTGYAYSLKHDPNQIFTKPWSSGSSFTEKAPTCVLISPQKKIEKFGYEAEDEYKNKKDDGVAEEYYFFQRFKMKLYLTKQLNRNTTIADIHGKEMLALDVFAMVIRHLKENLESDMKKRTVGLQDDDILWVLTVPAIWSDSAKQFMREAAEQAGIPYNHVRLVLEPEAGSLFCNKMHFASNTNKDGTKDVGRFPVGQKYIVADLGGGTVDISVHEIIENRNLREVYRSDGGPYGGTMVDTEFVSFLEEVFGKEVIQQINEHHYETMLDLQNDFETKKCNFNPESKNPVRIKIPAALIRKVTKAIGKESFEDRVRRATKKNAGKIDVKADKLSIFPELFVRFFEKTTEGIINQIRSVRKEDKIGEIKTLLMIGGFSCSIYVQKVIKRDLPDLEVIVPQEANLAVLKGAVLSGHNPRFISERIARYTYGFSFRIPFEKGKHPEELKIVDEGRELCCNVFHKIITKGDTLRVGDCYRSDSFHGNSRNNPSKKMCPLLVALYRSDEIDPKYTAVGYGCELVGNIILVPSPAGWPKTSIIANEIVVGESEFTIKGSNLKSGDQLERKLDFLTLYSSE